MFLIPDANINAYASLNMGSNHTFSIETTLLSTDKLNAIKEDESISGYTKWIENMVIPNNVESHKNLLGKHQNAGIGTHGVAVPEYNLPGYADKDILIMTVSSWEKRRQDNVQEDSTVVGVLLLDEDEYRPSSPLKVVTQVSDSDHSAPIFLVRLEDQPFVHEYINH